MVCDILVRPVPDDVFSRDTTRVEAITISTGGDALNVAMNLARLDTPVSLIGRTGDDEAGRFVVDAARKTGVDVRRVVRTPEMSTATVVVLVQADGRHAFVYVPGANDLLNAGDVDPGLFDGSDLFVLSGALALRGLDCPSIAALFETARAAGLVTVLDVASDVLGLSPQLPVVFPHTDVFLPNYEEASHLSGETELGRIARHFVDRGVGTVVIKTGEEGAYYRSHGKTGQVPGYQSRVVDTTGAGDSFVSGFVAAHARGIPAIECIRYGNAMGALCVRNLGASTVVAGFEEVSGIVECGSLPE